MVVVLGIYVAGCYEVQPLPLQTLPFAQRMRLEKTALRSFPLAVSSEVRCTSGS